MTPSDYDSMTDEELRKTVFSPCRRYRYALWREWWNSWFDDSPTPYLMVIGLNPSTADETNDDPTIRRCIGFAKLWGFGALCMTNLFAWRDTKPEGMKRAADPVGEANNQWLLRISGGAGMILAAWGTHGSFMERDSGVRAILPAMKCLRKNVDGSPQHPLYVPSSTIPVPY